MDDIVFLDFDGVLNRGAGKWHRDLVLRLNRVTDQTGAKIVIHSTWRYNRSLEVLRNCLTLFSKHLDAPPVVTGEILDVCESPTCFKNDRGIWVTSEDWAAYKGDIETEDERAIAIQRWLNTHPGQVRRYVIFDDSPKLGHFVGKPEFIQTKTHEGLTDDHVQRAILHLKGVTW